MIYRVIDLKKVEMFGYKIIKNKNVPKKIGTFFILSLALAKNIFIFLLVKHYFYYILLLLHLTTTTTTTIYL